MVVNLRELAGSAICIVSIRNQKKGFLFSSQNPAEYLLQLIKKINLRSKDIHPELLENFQSNDLEFKVLETGLGDDLLSINICKTNWYRKLQEEGWNLLNSQIPTNYSVIKRLVSVGKEYFVAVYLKPAGKDRPSSFRLIGVFLSDEEATTWIERYYPNEKITALVMASNRETKRFLHHNQYT